MSWIQEEWIYWFVRVENEYTSPTNKISLPSRAVMTPGRKKKNWLWDLDLFMLYWFRFSDFSLLNWGKNSLQCTVPDYYTRQVETLIINDVRGLRFLHFVLEVLFKYDMWNHAESHRSFMVISNKIVWTRVEPCRTLGYLVAKSTFKIDSVSAPQGGLTSFSGVIYKEGIQQRHLVTVKVHEGMNWFTSQLSGVA